MVVSAGGVVVSLAGDAVVAGAPVGAVVLGDGGDVGVVSPGGADGLALSSPDGAFPLHAASVAMHAAAAASVILVCMESPVVWRGHTDDGRGGHAMR